MLSTEIIEEWKLFPNSGFQRMRNGKLLYLLTQTSTQPMIENICAVIDVKGLLENILQTPLAPQA